MTIGDIHLSILDPPRKKVREKQTTRGASSQGYLPMTLDDYLKLFGFDRLPDPQGQVRTDFGRLRSDPAATAMRCRDLVGLREELPQAVPQRSGPGSITLAVSQPAENPAAIPLAT